MDYLNCFLEEGDYEGCLTKTKIDETKLDNCVLNNAEAYYEEDSQLSQDYGVQGSPTLVINGDIVSSGRSQASFLSTICSAFSEPPEECDQELDSTNPSPGFGSSQTEESTSASCGV